MHPICSLPLDLYPLFFLSHCDKKSSSLLPIPQQVSTFSLVCKALQEKVNQQFWHSLMQTAGPQRLRLRQLPFGDNVDWQALAKERFKILRLMPWIDNVPILQEQSFPGSYFQDAFMSKDGIEHFKRGHQVCGVDFILILNGFIGLPEKGMMQDISLPAGMGCLVNANNTFDAWMARSDSYIAVISDVRSLKFYDSYGNHLKDCSFPGELLTMQIVNQWLIALCRLSKNHILMLCDISQEGTPATQVILPMACDSMQVGQKHILFNGKSETEGSQLLALPIASLESTSTGETVDWMTTHLPSILSFVTPTEDYFIGLASNPDGTMHLHEIEIADTQILTRTLESNLMLRLKQEPKVFKSPEVFAMSCHYGKLFMSYFDVEGQAYALGYDLFSGERFDAFLDYSIGNKVTPAEDNWEYKTLLSNFRFKILSTAGKVCFVYTASRNLTELTITQLDYLERVNVFVNCSLAL